MLSRDVTVITLHDSYPNSQFFTEGFRKPYRMGRKKLLGGILIYIRENTPSKQLFKHKFIKEIEGMFIEVNLTKKQMVTFSEISSTKTVR